MENIWSENKKVNLIINILLFLLGMNFMHYAQLLIPIICIIIFFANNHKFHVNNIKTFIILCLFGISFLIFAYEKKGFFAFIGLFLPMAYYIGSNIYRPNETKIKQVIYILAFGMLIHIVLNFGVDLAIRGIECIRRNSHLDIWTFDEYPATQTATNYILPIGCLYYYLVYDNKNKSKILVYPVLLVSFIYMFALGKRAPMVILFIVLVIMIFCDVTIYKKINKASKTIIALVFLLLITASFVYIVYLYDLFGLKNKIPYISIVRKFYAAGFDPQRLHFAIETIKNAPQHLFGGSYISETFGFGPHELWLDIFDIAGIIPYALIVIYSIISLFVIINTLKNKEISKEFKILFIGVFTAVILEFFIEPIISGASILLLSVIIILSCVERLQLK